MSYSNYNEELYAKLICLDCVGEAYLSKEIEDANKIGCCDYCGKTAPCKTLVGLAASVEEAFGTHYVRSSDQPSSWQARILADKESTYEWDRDGTPVLDAISDAALISTKAASDVLKILSDQHYDNEAAQMGEESEFDGDSYYEERSIDGGGWQREWLAFERSLKSRARFFSQSAATHLDEIFGGIDRLRTRDGRSLVVNAGPEAEIDHLYRARVFQSDEALEQALLDPARLLGSPPHNLARAGRMNAQGISVFYGAMESKVAIAEVRAPVGSRVAVARFCITTSLRLLDLTALSDVHIAGSIFDPTFKHLLEKSAFLRTLGYKMARPVMPDDESIDYLPTQAVADFLATMNEPRLDGIIFSSAQTEVGCNVVLFHHAARVTETFLPENTELTALLGHWSEDGWEPSYTVFESVPKQPLEELLEDGDSPESTLSGVAEFAGFGDSRSATLEVDLESVTVHVVRAVEVKTIEFPVPRYRVSH